VLIKFIKRYCLQSTCINVPEIQIPIYAFWGHHQSHLGHNPQWRALVFRHLKNAQGAFVLAGVFRKSEGHAFV
jgi:hypothetical protein